MSWTMVLSLVHPMPPPGGSETAPAPGLPKERQVKRPRRLPPATRRDRLRKRHSNGAPGGFTSMAMEHRKPLASFSNVTTLIEDASHLVPFGFRL